MAHSATGGVAVRRWSKLKRFHKEYGNLEQAMRDLVDSKLQDLVSVPMPPGLKFEKLHGHSNPDIYTFHVTGNYKVSLEIVGDHASLRRVATHNEIDRAP